MTDWEKTGAELGWVMPAAVWWKRLPVIRHVRAILGAVKVAIHNRFYRSIGLIPTGYDDWVLHGMWIGREPKP